MLFSKYVFNKKVVEKTNSILGDRPIFRYNENKIVKINLLSKILQIFIRKKP